MSTLFDKPSQRWMIFAFTVIVFMSVSVASGCAWYADHLAESSDVWRRKPGLPADRNGRVPHQAGDSRGLRQGRPTGRRNGAHRSHGSGECKGHFKLVRDGWRPHDEDELDGHSQVARRGL